MLLRLAAPDDAMPVAQVHVRSWQVAYRGLLPEDYLKQLRPEERAQRYDFSGEDQSKPATIVAVEQGSAQSILGFATIARSRDADLPGYGEIYALYVDPAKWGTGIGAALIADARQRLSALGFCDALLWVLAGNLRAQRFYANDGWCADGHSRMDTVWGVTVNEMRYQRRLR